MRRARREWVEGHLPEAARLGTLLTGDRARGVPVAEDAVAAALQVTPSRRSDARLADAVLTQLVRRSRRAPPPRSDEDSEQLRVLASLPHRQRAALVLRHYADLPEERVAVVLGCSPRAASDLATKAIRRLPVEARSDLHEWLDAAPGPAPSTRLDPRAVAGRARRRALVRSIAATTAVAAGVVGGFQVPDLFRDPDRPSPGDRLVEVRRILEQQEATLPFDPDDPGPGATRPFRVVDGVVGGNLWTVSAYHNPSGSPCLQLVVSYDFGSRRCLGGQRTPIRAIVDVDIGHDATFISGMVGPRVQDLTFVGPEVSFMDVTLGRENPGSDEPAEAYFGIALPDHYLPVESRRAGGMQGYEVYPGTLTARDADGTVVAELELLLAQPR